MRFIPKWLKLFLSAKWLSSKEDVSTNSKESDIISQEQSLWDYLQGSIPGFSVIVSQACSIDQQLIVLIQENQPSLKNILRHNRLTMK